MAVSSLPTSFSYTELPDTTTFILPESLSFTYSYPNLTYNSNHHQNFSSACTYPSYVTNRSCKSTTHVNRRPRAHSLLCTFINTSTPSSLVVSNIGSFVPLPMTFSNRRIRLSFGKRKRANRSTSPTSPFTDASTSPISKTSPRTHRRAQANIDWPALSRRANNAISRLTETNDPITHETNLRECVENDPTNPFLWHALARHIAYTEKDVIMAIRILSEAVRTVPVGSRGGLFEAWGTLEFRRGNVDLALRIFTDATCTDSFSSLYTSLAITQSKLYLFEDARKTFQRGALAFPSNAPLWRAWATFESKHGNRKVALERWREAVEKDPTHARGWQMLVVSEQKCGSSPAQIGDILHEALVSCPDDCKLRMQLARIEEKRRGQPVARSILAGVEDQNNPDVLRYIARLCFDTGDPAAGRYYFRRTINAEISMSKTRQERQSLSKYGKKNSCIRSLHAWALLETRESNLKGAREILLEARSICDTDSGIWRALAEIESRDRNYAKAREAFATANAIAPNDHRVILAWGKTERLAGNLEKAEEIMSQLESIDFSNEPRSTPILRDESKSTIGTEPSSHKTIQTPIPETEANRTISLTPSVLAAALRERATIAARDGRFTDSHQLLSRACQIEPISESGWRLLAAQELQINGIKEARKVYERGLQLVSQRMKPKLLHWWGQDERSTENIQRARELFRKATIANPGYMSAWMSWGLLEKSEGQLRQACAIFEEAADKAESDLVRAPFIFQAWGRIEELDRGRPEQAAEIFNRGARLVPRSGPLLSEWGLLEQRRGNIERARELFQKGTIGDPTYGSTWHSWALLEAARCNYERSLELFNMGLENDPTNAALIVSWAMIEGQLANVKHANELFENATSIDPQFVNAWQEWGRFQMEQGNLERAREIFMKALKLKSNDASCWHSLGVLEAEYYKNVEAAVDNWMKAIKVYPTYTQAYISWALLEAKNIGDLEEARRIFDEGLRHIQRGTIDSAIILQSWGALEHSHGNTEIGHELLSKALQEDSRHAKTWKCLAQIENSLGNRDQAQQLLNDGIEVSAPASSTAPLLVMLGSMKAEDGELDQARSIFTKAIRANPSVEDSWRAFVKMETKYGSLRQADEIEQTANSLFIRDSKLGTK